MTQRQITNRKRTEEALREFEERWRALVENSADTILTVDRDGAILFVNRDVLGVSAEEAVGMSAYDYVPPGYRDMLRERFDLVLNTGDALSFEIAAIGSNGSTSWYATRVGPIKSADQVDSLIIITTDITDRKRAEERLQETSRLVVVGELAAGIAHELNNPLAAVTGFAQLLMMRDLPGPIAEAVGKIFSEAERAAKVVHNLLAFARRHEPEKRYIDVVAVLERVLALKAYNLRVNNIETKTQFVPDLPKTMADEHQLTQVFLNIVTNAEQAMEDVTGGGTFSVAASRSGEKIRLSFSDDGPGIRPEHLGRIFDPFFTTQDLRKGTGLGLSRSYGMVHAHEGEIWAESALGQGATFYVELPIVEPKMEPNERSESSLSPCTEGKRVLVVDDEPLITEIFYKALTRDGYIVDVTEDGEEAWRALHRNPYDCIIMDLKMPGISGKELFYRLEQWDEALARKVVFLTGDTLSDDSQTFMESTGNRSLNKPFTLEELKRNIQDCVTNQQ